MPELPTEGQVQVAIMTVLRDGRDRTTTELLRMINRRKATRNAVLLQVTAAIRTLKSQGRIVEASAEEVRKAR